MSVVDVRELATRNRHLEQNQYLKLTRAPVAKNESTGNRGIRSQLSPREKLFCVKFIETGCGALAARLAGYADTEASNTRAVKLRAKPKIKKYLKELEDIIMGKAMVSAEWKYKKLQLTADRAMPDEIEEITQNERMFINPNACISAIAELNKMEGTYAPTKSINANVNAELDVDRAEELMLIYEKEF